MNGQSGANVAERSRQDLAREIQRIRESLGFTMAEFARRIGVSEASVSRYEAGKHIPSPEVMEQVARLGSKAPGAPGGFLGRYLNLRERERVAAAIDGVQEEYQIGGHMVQLLANGDLWIDGHTLVR